MMIRKMLLTLAIIQTIALSYAVEVNDTCQRIISLSPTVTDTLLSLGLENNIIAGTRYDRLPEGSTIEYIGGMLDPNYEAIVSKNPTIIFADLKEDSTQKRTLDRLNLPNVILRFNSFKDIEESLDQIGQICDILDIVHNKKIEFIKKTQKIDTVSPKKLLIMYTYEGDDYIHQLPTHAAGKSFHQDILEISGAVNAYQGSISAPIISQEGLLILDPEILILMQGNNSKILSKDRTIAIKKIQPAWKNLQSIRAIQSDNVYLLEGEATFIASPDAIMATINAVQKLFDAQTSNL